MDHGDDLNDLRLQFQVLQKQQERRKLERIKEKEAAKADAFQDDLDLAKQDIIEDSLENR